MNLPPMGGSFYGSFLESPLGGWRGGRMRSIRGCGRGIGDGRDWSKIPHSSLKKRKTATVNFYQFSLSPHKTIEIRGSKFQWATTKNSPTAGNIQNITHTATSCHRGTRLKFSVGNDEK